MKDNKVLNFIIRRKAYVIILFLVIIATLSTSFALFRQDIIGQNTYSMDVVDLEPVIYSADLTNNQITLSANETKEITVTLSNNDVVDAKFNFFYTTTSNDATASYKTTTDTPPTNEGEVFTVNQTKTYTIVLTNTSSQSQTITFGSTSGFTQNPLDFPENVLELTRVIDICEETPYEDGTPNPPELVGDMIPVVYDGTNWVKADTSNSSNSWYNYNTQEWANAVTVTSTNRATYVAAAVGTTIPMSDINTFMVWIPRYSYTIKDTYGVQGCGGDTPSVTTPGAFDIKFISSSITDKGSAEYTGDTAENWFTNSAFCWGNSCDDESTRSNLENRELSGIWVAKFESSTADTTCTSSASSSNCNKILQPISLPNAKSWRYVNISNVFNSTQQYMNSTNGETVYGLSGSTYDAHMMKNTEWGAVAYLNQSRYGKYGNEDYTGANKEVAINNCSSYITGIAGNTVSASSSSSSCSTNTYNTVTGQSASTTGNITGIYDMSGGVHERVMGNSQNSSGAFNVSSSGFTTVPDAKYYNNYDYGTSSSNYTRYIKGDATKEMAGFYSDYKSFAYASYPWFSRGGYYYGHSSAGLASFSNSNSYVDVSSGGRVVLAP